MRISRQAVHDGVRRALSAMGDLEAALSEFTPVARTLADSGIG